MRSSFGNLNTAARALAAQQVAIETTTHNIANANTPGFSRQETVMETTDPFTMPTMNRSRTAGQVGTGVNVATVRRLRDGFLDGQIRHQTAGLGEQQVQQDALRQVEAVFPEPSENGLNATMSRFFNSWQAVANRPEDRAVRAVLVEEAQTFSTMIAHGAQQFDDLRRDLNQQIVVKTSEINSIAERVAKLNSQIGQVEASGQQPNDLRDQRDLLVTQLSKLTRVSTAENANGSLNLFVGSRGLVLGDTALTLSTGFNVNGDTAVIWQEDGSAAQLGSGEVQGLATVRDGVLKDQRLALDTLAAGIVSQVNAVHTAGFGLTDVAAPSRAFFTGTDATSMAVNSAIITDPGLVAAAAGAGQPGDNSQALAIAKLRDALTMSGGTATFHGFYQSTTATLGAASKEASIATANQQLLVDMLNRRQESVAGVNMDEEATNLIKYQHAYQAAARVVTSIDEMLDQIINRMGRVGL